MKRNIDDIDNEQFVHSYAQAHRLSHISRYTFTLVFAAIGLFMFLFDADIAADYFRYFALGMGSFIIFFSIRIVRTAVFLGRITKGSPMALLPKHLILIVASYVIFVVSTHTSILYHFGDSVAWYGLPLYIVADVTGIFALGYIWRFQLYKRGSVK